MRRQERLNTQIFEEMDRRNAALREVAPGVTDQWVKTGTSAGEQGESAPVGVCQLLVRP